MLALVFVGLAVRFLTPEPLVYQPPLPPLPEDLDAWLAESEAASPYPLIPGTEKRIRWQQPGVKTEFSVVYLHGFSATRQEVAPLPERVADALGANLFETRLTGHGRQTGPMLETRAEDWLDDAAEAIAIGSRIGDRVVLLSTSTGGTLAVALSNHELFEGVESVVLMSPNFGPRDDNAAWLTRPGGPLIGRLLIGETRSWQATNDEHERYWSTSYNTSILVEVMRLVNRARLPSSLNFAQNVLMLYSARDVVVSVDTALQAFDELRAPYKQALAIDDAADPAQHVLAGRILSPNKTAEIAATIVEFVTRY